MAGNVPAAAQTLFKRRFGFTPVHVVRVPAPLALLGGLAEFNQGLAMSVAVDKYLEVASAPRADGRIELVSNGSPQAERFWISDLKGHTDAPWTEPVTRVLKQLRQRGVNFSGFSAAIDEEAGTGSGLQNSTTLAVAAGLTVRRLYPFGLGESGATVPPKRDRKGDLPPLAAAERVQFARLCHQSQPGAEGCSLLGCTTSLFSKAWQVASIDFRFMTVEHIRLIGAVFVVCAPSSAAANSPTDAPASASEIRSECESAARKLGAKSLRSVELSLLKANRSRLTEREFEYARHVVGEVQRIVHADRALQAEDLGQFGQYLFQSDQSAREVFPDNSEGNLLMELARAQPGCLGARRLNWGGGLATLNLVRHHEAQAFRQQMARNYEERTTRTLETFVCQVVDGAELKVA